MPDCRARVEKLCTRFELDQNRTTSGKSQTAVMRIMLYACIGNPAPNVLLVDISNTEIRAVEYVSP